MVSRTLLFLTILILSYNVNCSSHPSCVGTKPCLKYNTKGTPNDGDIVVKTPLYWYDTIVKACITLEEDCSSPNRSVTFNSMENCLKICTESIPSSLPPKECGQSNSGNCDKDLPPTSTSSTTTSSFGRKWSVIVSMMGGVGIVALVVVVIATTYAVRIQKNKENHRKKKLEKMLNTLSDPNSSTSSSSDDERFSNDPEDDNLFDRLERSQYTHYNYYT